MKGGGRCRSVRIFTHLWQNCSLDLQYKLYTSTGGADNDVGEEDLMKEIKRVSVQKVIAAVHVKTKMRKNL